MRQGLLAALLLLGGCVAVPGAPGGATVPAATLTPAALAARLPVEAAGFQRGATATVAEEGRETAYRTLGRIAAGATVELLRPAGAAIPAGIESPAVAEAFAHFIQDATRPMPQRQLRDEARFVLGQGAAALRCAATAGTYGREAVEGLLCVGGLGGGLLRLRVTMPRRDPAPADARAFAGAVLAALRSP
ncbi:MAG: hypothetical protein JWP04_499 [Belnapia sp.]|nr:hypothetical protein [Belnapia sp.]